MTRILVTGANGFIGGHVVRCLLKRGHEVAGLDLGFDPGAPRGMTAIAGDVTDPDAVRRALEGCRAVIHGAAHAGLWVARRADYARVNLGGTETVLAAARQAGARVVLISSYTTLIAASTPAGAVVDETAEHAAEALLGPYPASKRRAELAVMRAAAEGADALAVLPSAPVGPGDRRLTPPSRMILDLAAGRTPALIRTDLDLVDVRALADGIVAALDRGQAGRRYLLAGETISLAQVAGKIAGLGGAPAPKARVPMAVALLAARVEAGIAALTGRAPTAPLTGVRLAARPVTLDASRARTELGFEAPPIDAALKDALDWMRAEGLLG